MTTQETDSGATRRPLLEVGWVIAGPMDPVDVKAADVARRNMLSLLGELFPNFEWRMPIVRRREIAETAPVEPVAMLEHGSRERDVLRLDFVFILTESELKSYYKAFALGVPSKVMNVALLSTTRIDPSLSGDESPEIRIETMSRRILALSLHLFGHMNDLSHSENRDEFMFDLNTVTDLDAMERFSDRDLEHLEQELEEEADVRLEEAAGRTLTRNLFYVRAIRHRAVDIALSIFHTRPWLFPFRLSRLTTAAVSAMLVLIMTAEAWDLGMTQQPFFVILFSIAALVGTTIYILKRQRLFIRRHERGLSEQRVISNVSIVISVFTGMAVTYGLLFVSTLAVTHTIFSGHLVETWAASLEGQVYFRHYIILAGFVAMLGIVIGALGASFEAHGYFRHITYVDEET